MNVEVSFNTPYLDGIDCSLSDFYVNMTGEINEESAKKFCNELMVLDKKCLPVIPIYIQSGGGEVDSLLVMIAAMEQCVTPLATINLGSCSSAAAVLFALGSNGFRYMSPNAFLMFHEASTNLEGKGSDMFSSLSNLSKLDKLLNVKVEKHVGLDKGFFESQQVDFYLTAPEALKAGLVDHVGYPCFKVRFDVSAEIEMKKCRKLEDNQKKYKYTKYLTSIAPCEASHA